MNSVLIKIGKGRLLNIFSEKEKQFYRFKAVIHLMTHMLRKEKLLLLTFFFNYYYYYYFNIAKFYFIIC